MLEKHRFFCINCGKEGLPIYRNLGRQRGKMHRKKMFCIHCKQEVNMVECYSDEDVRKFKRNYENGVYKDEAEQSVVYCSRGA